MRNCNGVKLLFCRGKPGYACPVLYPDFVFCPVVVSGVDVSWL